MRYRLKVATWVVVRETGEPSPRTFRDPKAVAALAIDLARTLDDDKEHFWVVLLNGKHGYMMHSLVSTGSQAAAIVHPREVFGPALREGASAVLVVHNHPSGDPSPSSEDIDVTERLVKSGEVVGVRLLDHVIVGNGTEKWHSFQHGGLIR